MSSPNPLPDRLYHDREAVAQRRRLHCATYDDCLEQAAASNWDGFHCNGCTAYQHTDAEQLTQDVGGLIALAKEIDDG